MPTKSILGNPPTKATMAGIQPAGATPIHAALEHFDKLPDSAGARVPVVAALFSVSVPTVWRWARDGHLPAPMKRGGVTLWRVGDLRRALSEDIADAEARTASATAAATAKRISAPAA